MSDQVVNFTDGACSGNPGPGGWAWATSPEGVPQGAGRAAHTTNQRMEVQAVLEALRAHEHLPAGAITIVSDSTYVINCFRDKWYESWRKNGWVNSQKKPVENRDLWEALIELVEYHDVTWHKVAGHSGHIENDRVDALARAAIRR
jgi:ribonuclease HI